MATFSPPSTRHGRDAPFETDRVLLWPDTFNNYLASNVLQAAVEVLEHAGLLGGDPASTAVLRPPALRLRHARHRRAAVAPDPRRRCVRGSAPGVPVVGLEPSCVAAFRDELLNLFPHDDDARRLSEQTLLLSEFLERQRYDPPRLPTSATCTATATTKPCWAWTPRSRCSKRMGVDHEVLDSGCCGMAGSFGFAADHYEVSTRVGERVLLPAVRDLDDDTELVTDGFSCREQIEQGTDRSPVHVAELLRRAIRAADDASSSRADDLLQD